MADVAIRSTTEAGVAEDARTAQKGANGACQLVFWNDLRAGFVVHTNMAATLPQSAADDGGELLCDGACCLAALQHYDEAWSFAMTELNKDDVLEPVPRAALLLADVAQARQDSGNEVSYAQNTSRRARARRLRAGRETRA